MQSNPDDESDPLDLAELDNRCRWQLRPPPEFPGPWACEWGFDAYGLWQSFAIKGVKYKLRYLVPERKACFPKNWGCIFTQASSKIGTQSGAPYPARQL